MGWVEGTGHDHAISSTAFDGFNTVPKPSMNPSTEAADTVYKEPEPGPQSARNPRIDTVTVDDNDESVSSHHSSPRPIRRCNMSKCMNRKVFYNESELKRHIATHTRPFACSEHGCTAKSFGDKPGLDRHLREVHGRQIRGKPNQTFKCPELNCKRHKRGFAREHNMLEHHRRIHKDPNSDGVERGDSSSSDYGEEKDRALSSSVSVYDIAENNGTKDTTMETPTSFNEKEKYSTKTLQDLRNKRNALKEQRYKIDEKVNALTVSIRIMEECPKENTTRIKPNSCI